MAEQSLRKELAQMKPDFPADRPRHIGGASSQRKRRDVYDRLPQSQSREIGRERRDTEAWGKNHGMDGQTDDEAFNSRKRDVRLCDHETHGLVPAGHRARNRKCRPVCSSRRSGGRNIVH